MQIDIERVLLFDKMKPFPQLLLIQQLNNELPSLGCTLRIFNPQPFLIPFSIHRIFNADVLLKAVLKGVL
jgi:hypothetical protein